MFRFRNAWRTVVAMHLLAAVVGASLLTAVRAGNACSAGTVNQAAARRACSKPGQACCCTLADESRTCSCQAEPEPPVSPAPISSDSGRAPKWAPGNAGPFAPFSVAAGERAAHSFGRTFFAPPQRSVQSLLCIWRI